MKKQKLLRSLVATSMLASLILMAAACRQGAESTTAPPSDGTIEGVVRDADGEPIARMRLGIVNGTAPFPEIGPVTNEEGTYHFPAIPPGTFDVAVHDEQGNRIAVQSVEVRSGETSKLNFMLTPLQ